MSGHAAEFATLMTRDAVQARDRQLDTFGDAWGPGRRGERGTDSGALRFRERIQRPRANRPGKTTFPRADFVQRDKRKARPCFVVGVTPAASPVTHRR